MAIGEVALTLIKVAQLIIDISEVVELDINPLLADEFGVLALDARLRVRADDRQPGRRLAIRPYPRELEETIAWQGAPLLLRPIRPEDGRARPSSRRRRVVLPDPLSPTMPRFRPASMRRSMPSSTVRPRP